MSKEKSESSLGFAMSSGQFVLVNKPSQSVGQQKIAFGGRWMTLVEYTEAILKAREEQKTELISRMNNPTELPFPKPVGGHKKAPAPKTRESIGKQPWKLQPMRWSQPIPSIAPHPKFVPTNVQQYLENTLDNYKLGDQSQQASYMFNSPVMMDANNATMANYARAEWAPYMVTGHPTHAVHPTHPLHPIHPTHMQPVYSPHSMTRPEFRATAANAEGSPKKDAVKLKFRTSRLSGQSSSGEEVSSGADERVVDEVSESSEADAGRTIDPQSPVRNIKKIRLTCGPKQDAPRHTEQPVYGSAISYNASFNHTLTPPTNEAHLIMHPSLAHEAPPQGQSSMTRPSPQRSVTSTLHDGRLFFSLKPESRALLVPGPLKTTAPPQGTSVESTSALVPPSPPTLYPQPSPTRSPDSTLPSMVVSGTHSAPLSHVSVSQAKAPVPQSHIVTATSVPQPTSVPVPSLSTLPKQAPQPTSPSSTVSPSLPGSPSAIAPDDYKPLESIEWMELCTVPLEHSHWPRYQHATPVTASPFSMLRRSYYERIAHRECVLGDGKVNAMDMFKSLKRSYSVLASSEESDDRSEESPVKRRRLGDEDQSNEEPRMALLDLTMSSQSAANVTLITLESPRDSSTAPAGRPGESATIVTASSAMTVASVTAAATALSDLENKLTEDQSQSTVVGPSVITIQSESSESQSPDTQMTGVKVETARDERDEILHSLMRFFDMEDKIKQKQEELAELFVQHQKMRQNIEGVLKPFMKYTRLTASQSSQEDNK